MRTAINRLVEIVRRAIEPQPESGVGLALLRVVVSVLVVVAPEGARAVALSARPDELVHVPEGLGWTVGLVPISPALAEVARFVVIGSATTSALGYRTRLSLATLTISGLYLFSIPQRTGAVLHDMHLFWLTALLAVSPSGDVLSLDAWETRRSWLAPAHRYGAALRWCRWLLAAIYFFPGMWKLRVGGLAWLSGEALIGQAHWKWLEHGWVAAFRFDRNPVLCAVAASAVVALECGFPILVSLRRGRWLALAGGLTFHLLAECLLAIPFVGLWGCYVVLVDWCAVLGRPAPPAERGEPPRRRVTVVAGLLLAAAGIQGMRHAMQAWPFACYPTFADVPPRELWDLSTELELDDGRRVTLSDREGGRVRSQERWGQVWRIAGAYGDPPDRRALVAWARRIAVETGAASELARAGRMRVYRVTIAVSPDRRDDPPIRSELLVEATAAEFAP